MKDAPGDRCTLAASVGPYLLNALEPDERAAFEHHLDDCGACSEDVARLRSAADALALAPPPLAPPPQLKRAVMAVVEREAAQRAGAEEPRRRRSLGAALRARPALALSAAMLLVAGVLVGGVLGTVVGGSGRATRTLVREATVRAAGARGYLETVGDVTTLHVSGLPSPPLGRIYEVWLARSASVPAPTDALFGVDMRGDATVEVPGSLRGVRQVLVTDEPLGGSAVPTTLPVIVARV